MNMARKHISLLSCTYPQLFAISTLASPAAGFRYTFGDIMAPKSKTNKAKVAKDVAEQQVTYATDEQAEQARNLSDGGGLDGCAVEEPTTAT